MPNSRSFSALAWTTIALCIAFGPLLGSHDALAATKLKLLHTPPKALQLGNSYTFRCQIPENEELDVVSLYFRRQGDTRYRSLTMKLHGGDRYKATLQKFQLRPPAIEYYIAGIDVDKKVHILFASPKKPQSIKLVTELKKPAARKTQDTKPEDDDPLDSSQESDTVFSAGRKEQRIQNAPGVISVLTEAEIRAGGWRSVLELLRFSTGIDINHNGHSPDIGIRGLNPRQAFGDKLIILVDGHNMVWRQFNRNLLNPSWVSIDNIKRIEIIRGPGSALWGANALSGVINIITKTNTDLSGFESVGGGSPLSRSYYLTLQGGQELFGGVTFRGSFSLFQENQTALTMAPIYEFKQKGITYTPSGMQAFSQNFYGQLTWRGFNLRVHQSRYIPSAAVSGSNLIAGSSAIGGDDTRHSTNRTIVRLTWTSLLGSWGTISLWSSIDSYGYDRDARLEVNSLSPFNSNTRLRGASESFAIYERNQSAVLQFQRYYPACSELPTESNLPCIRLTRAGSRGELVCSVVANPRQPPNTGQLYSYSEFIPKECRHVFRNGRYVLGQRAHDTRFEAGLLLSTQPIGGFSLSAGVEFEYLYALGYHFPEFEAYDAPPNFTNVHLSGFLQLQYNIKNIVELTLGGRLDYDSRYNVIFTPRASVVFTPGAGFYGKLLYGNAFKAPSIQDRFLFIDRDAVLFGNPSLNPESVHSIELQVGWYRKGILAISANAYLSFYRDLITPIRRDKFDEFLGEDQLPEERLPSRKEDFVQKANTSQITTYGGSLELRLFPARALNISANFGLYLGQDAQGNPLPFASVYRGSLTVSYRLSFPAFGLLLAAGAHITGPKLVPQTSFSLPQTFLPAQDTANAQGPTPTPGWSQQDDPSANAPLAIRTYATIQFLRILKTIDIGIRLNNFLNREQYDANDILLYPQPKLDVTAWLRVKL